MLDTATRQEVTALLAYKEGQAGGLMSPRFARLRPEMTVDEAIGYLRRQAAKLETMYYAYAVDSEQHLLGVVSFRDLFSADRTKTVRDAMRTRFVTATEEMDQEALARLFSEHHLLAIPVLDGQGRMQGIVTIDDIVGVVEREAGEDIQKIGGSEAFDEPYLRISFVRMVKKRGGWLAALFLGEMLTATAMGFFEKEIAKAVVLALLIQSFPAVETPAHRPQRWSFAPWLWADSSRSVVACDSARGLRGNRPRSAPGVNRNDPYSGLAAVAKPYGEHYMLVGLTVAFSLVGVVLFGTMVGSMLPFVLRALGVDPASASAPFVATLVDVTGLVIYFTIASIVMRGTLL